jgi:hypothetical protein
MADSLGLSASYSNIAGGRAETFIFQPSSVDLIAVSSFFVIAEPVATIPRAAAVIGWFGVPYQAGFLQPERR